MGITLGWGLFLAKHGQLSTFTPRKSQVSTEHTKQISPTITQKTAFGQKEVLRYKSAIPGPAVQISPKLRAARVRVDGNNP